MPKRSVCLEAWKQVLVRIRKKEAGKKEVIALLGL
jgi:hypothetical protein